MFGLLPYTAFKPALAWVVDLKYMGSTPVAWLGERTSFPTINLPSDTTPEQRDLIFWAYERGFMAGRMQGEERVRDGIRSLLGIRRGS